MLDFGITNVILFLLIVGACLFFVVAWILKSETGMNGYRSELTRLKGRLDSSEREKFMLSERVTDSVPSDPPAVSDAELKHAAEEKSTLLLQALEQNSSLENENKKLKLELADARISLEEIYKALVDKK